jgi:chemotaxis protein histidine kinase CheA
VQATEQQQQILRFFIEEAKEHLDTIEQGLLNLQATMADSEAMNHLFRAAHSVKGGAAMLGIDSILKTGHYLEDYFKLIKENPIKVDRKLEDLFLQGFDGMKELVEALQSPFGLRPEDEEQALKRSVPVFKELGEHLQVLINGSKAATKQAPATNPATAQVQNILKMMLQLFKQGDNPKSRQQLSMLCTKLAALNKTSKPWINLLQMSQRAIANPKAPFSALAPVIIKELKTNSELVMSGRSGEVLPSRSLQQLATAPALPETSAARTVVKPVAEPIANNLANNSASNSASNSKSPSGVGVATRRQITIPADPKGAARSLLDQFNKSELIQIAEFLMKAIQ